MIGFVLFGFLFAGPAPDVYRVRVDTTVGAFTMEVTRSLAPIGADRFYELVKSGFYDDSRFFRVIPGSFAQFGIPGDPAKNWDMPAFADDRLKTSNLRGSFAFAMTGPGARTTQIFISTADQPRQDALGFAPLGRVVEGMDVVDRLYSGYAETSGGGMRAGKQQRLFAEGNAYLDREFPKLDKLVRARIQPK